MSHVKQVTIAMVPVEFAFNYVADYRNMPDWVFGVRDCAQVGSQVSGVGTTFDSAIHLGPVAIKVRGEICQCQENTLVAMRTIKGMDGEASWAFAPIDDNTVQITLDIAYTVPGGLAGMAIDRAIKVAVAPGLRHIEKHLREQLQTRYASSR